MTTEAQVSELIVATTELLDAVNMRKAVLDDSADTAIDAASLAESYRLATGADRVATGEDRLATGTERVAAELAKDEAIAAATVSGDVVFVQTFADAESKLPLPDGTAVEVSQDESHDGDRTRYIVAAGELVFAVNLNQQMKKDLANTTDPDKGAGLVGWSRLPLTNAISTVGGMLSAQSLNIWEFASLITDKPNETDPWTWDWSPAVQAASDFVRSAFNANGPGVTNVIEFPAGRYKIKSQVVISVFAKLKSNGLVIFETSVENDSAFHFTPNSNDYSSNSAVLDKQQWHRGPFINGSSGGFVFKNQIARSGCTAIEIGPRADFGELRPFSRYSACDFAVAGYGAAIKFNRFRNYIGLFSRVHLENNNELCVFGDAGTIVKDSGENISFSDSVFAICETAFRWHVDGFDLNCTDCSFDYIGTIFRLGRLYKKITVQGGHIEAIGGTRSHDGIGGIVVEESVHGHDGGINCTVMISGVCAYVAPGRMIRGSSRLIVTLDMEYRKFGTANAPELSFLCDKSVAVRRANIIMQQRTTIPSWSLNRLRNGTFDADDVDADVRTTPPTGYTVSQNVASAVVSSDNIPLLGGKSIKITGRTTSTHYILNTTSKMPVAAGETVLATTFVKFPAGGTGEPQVAVQIVFYDENDTLISSTSESLNFLGNLGITRGDFCMPAYARQAVAPVGATYFRTRHGVSGNAFLEQDVYITGLYATVLR